MIYQACRTSYITPDLRNEIKTKYPNLESQDLDVNTRTALWRTLHYILTSTWRYRDVKKEFATDSERLCIPLNMLRALGWDKSHAMNTKSIVAIIEALLGLTEGSLQLKVARRNSGAVSSINITQFSELITRVLDCRLKREAYDLSGLVDFITGVKSSKRMEKARIGKYWNAITSETASRIAALEVSDEDRAWLSLLNQPAKWKALQTKSRQVADTLIGKIVFEDTPKSIYLKQKLSGMRDYGMLSIYIPTPHSPRLFNISDLSPDSLPADYRRLVLAMLNDTATEVDLAHIHISLAAVIWPGDMSKTHAATGDKDGFWEAHLSTLPGFTKQDDKGAALPMMYGAGTTLLKETLGSKYAKYIKDPVVKEIRAGQKAMFKLIKDNKGFQDLLGKWISTDTNSIPSVLAQVMQSGERLMLNPTRKIWGSHRNSCWIMSWLHDGFTLAGNSQNEVEDVVKRMKHQVDIKCKKLGLNTRLKSNPLKDFIHPEYPDILKDWSNPVKRSVPPDAKVLADYDQVLKGELDTSTPEKQKREVDLLTLYEDIPEEPLDSKDGP